MRYGLLIPHYGTIVVNNDTCCGNFAVIHTFTCIGGIGKIIDNGLYLSGRAEIMGDVKFGEGVFIASNSVVNKSYKSNILLTGMSAGIEKTNYFLWYVRDGEKYCQRVIEIEKLSNRLLSKN